MWNGFKIDFLSSCENCILKCFSQGVSQFQLRAALVSQWNYETVSPPYHLLFCQRVMFTMRLSVWSPSPSRGMSCLVYTKDEDSLRFSETPAMGMDFMPIHLDRCILNLLTALIWGHRNLNAFLCLMLGIEKWIRYVQY